MAKVKITGHASGSGVITVTAPNTSTDRTITLPDATATIATTTDVAARLPSITDGGNATAITIDSSEKIGIGTTSPGCAAKGVHIKTSSAGTFPSLQTDADDLVIEGSTPGITLLGAANGGGMLAFGDPDDADAGRIFYYHINNTMDFVTAGATAMSINSAGKVGIGETPDANFGLKVKNNVVASSLETTSGTGSHEALIIDRTGSDGWMIAFNRDGSTKGGIVQSGSSTAFNTSSDYRLKENVDYTWDATTRLKQLKPARFNFIEDETNTLVDGFLAHEAATVVPEAITGTKDAMKDEEYEVTPAVMDGETVVTEAVMGTRSVPHMQGIDQSKLVPLLVKTIQELEARITALEA